MTSYLEIEKLFGTPLNKIPVPRTSPNGVQIAGIIIIVGLAVYGLYKLVEEKPKKEADATSQKGVPITQKRP